MMADMTVVNLGGELLLDVDPGVTGLLLDRLREFVFTEDVTVEDRTAAWRALARCMVPSRRTSSPTSSGRPRTGPRWRRTRSAVGRSIASGPGGSGTPRWAAVRSNEIGEVGFLLYAGDDAARPLTDALAGAGAAELDAETFALLRLEAGRPAFPADMDERTIPLEAGIESRAISQTKGCYVGQEVIVRILHRGQGRIARRLVGLHLGESDPPPEAGAALFAVDRPDADPVGEVTTARRSPALGRAIALGYVRRELTEPGAGLVVSHDDRRLPAVVTARPFVPLPTATRDG